MNTVVPLKDKRSINKMKKSLRKGRYGERNVLIFSMGINTAYRILLNHSSQRDTLRYIGITQEDKDIAVMSLNL